MSFLGTHYDGAPCTFGQEMLTEGLQLLNPRLARPSAAITNHYLVNKEMKVVIYQGHYLRIKKFTLPHRSILRGF